MPSCASGELYSDFLVSARGGKVVTLSLKDASEIILSNELAQTQNLIMNHSVPPPKLLRQVL